MTKKSKSDHILLETIVNDLARHNAEHAHMLDRLEAIHLLMGEFKVHQHTLDDEQLRHPLNFYTTSYPL